MCGRVKVVVLLLVSYAKDININIPLSLSHTHTKQTHHRKRSAFLHFQKTPLRMIYKLFSSLGPKKCPIRKSILYIDIFVGTFCPHNVGFTEKERERERIVSAVS